MPIELVNEKEQGAAVHNSTKKYYTGNIIWHNGALQRCKAYISAKTFAQADWQPIKSSAFWEAINEDVTTAYIYKGGLNSSSTWQINRYDRLKNLARAKANQTNNSTTSLVNAWNNRTILTYT